MELQKLCVRLIVLSSCFGLAFSAGCSGGDQGKYTMPELGKVEGTVLLDGAPLEKAQVEFIPANSRSSMGVTDSEGGYILTFDATHKGAAVGVHTVKITTRIHSAEDLIDKVPPKYNEETTLTGTVKDGDNEINFDLKSSP